MTDPVEGLLDDGTMAQCMRTHDWTTSPLGAPSSWPQALRTVAALVLDSKAPMFVAWGTQHCMLYNDAYVSILGERHPHALGRPLPEVWAEIWHDIRPLVEKTLSGQGQRFENVPFTIRRNGIEEPTWFTFLYSPIRDADGRIGGLYAALAETTAQVVLEERRAQEIARLYKLFEQAPGFMAVLSGPTHIYELANAAYLRFVGQRDLIGKSVKDVFPELAGQGYMEALDRVYASGQPFIGHKLLISLKRRPGGRLEQRFVDFVFQPMFDPAGNVSGIFIEGSDVTTHKHTEDNLRASERRAITAASLLETERNRLNALLDAAPVGIGFAGTDGRLILANAENKRLWGGPPLSGVADEHREWKGWWADRSARHGQRIKPHEWGLARALRGEEVTNDLVEIEPFGMPGVRRTMLLRATPVRNAAGEIINAVVAQMDVSERIRAEAAQLESEAKFRTITDAMPQMVWSALPDGHHDYYNRQWHEFTGVAEGAMCGSAWNTMFHADDRQQARDLWHQSLRTGEPFDLEFRLRHRSGQYRWVLGRAVAVRNDKGAIVRWMGTYTDIHEQKLAQEALKESDRRKDEFLAMLAHELRNPLAPIAAAADLLSVAPVNEARVRQLSEIVARHAGHMTSLIDDLLDVSRVTRGLITLNLEEVDIKSLLAEAVEQVRPLTEARAHRLDTQVTTERAAVMGDKKRLVQVVANLLSNAAKYTPNGGHIVLRMDVDAERVLIAVRDNGIGMPAELLTRAFELFAQGERTPDRSQGGLGIGLALVKSLVQLHGGTVSAHSAGPGAGSEFTVVLPRLHQKTHPAPARKDAPAVPAISDAVRVLVVDDNADAAQLLAMYLQTFGYEVFVEYQADKAIDCARRMLPRVCLLDIGLPGMDGNELARQLRMLPGMAHAILAAVTGYGRSQDQEAAFAAGFDHHFVKPLDTQKLLAWIGEAVRQNH